MKILLEFIPSPKTPQLTETRHSWKYQCLKNQHFWKRWENGRRTIPTRASNNILKILDRGSIFSRKNRMDILWILGNQKPINQETKKPRNFESKKQRNQQPRNQQSKKLRNQETSMFMSSRFWGHANAYLWVWMYQNT